MDAPRRFSVRPDNVGPDLDNLTEEVECLGRSQVDKTEGTLFRLPEHAVLAEADGRDRRRGPAEMAAFCLNANRAYRPSMRQLGLPEAWRTARHLAARKVGRDLASLPFTLDLLLCDLPLDDLPRALRAP